MTSASRALAIAFFALIALPTAIAQDRPSLATTPDLVGTWVGKADFMLDDGITKQEHVFEVEEQDGVFLRGHHRWSIVGQNLTSNDGSGDVFEAREPFLGVIAHNGIIHIVEHGDDTRFEMELLNRYTMDFVATEGGDHPLVGHGVLVRE